MKVFRSCISLYMVLSIVSAKYSQAKPGGDFSADAGTSATAQAPSTTSKQHRHQHVKSKTEDDWEPFVLPLLGGANFSLSLSQVSIMVPPFQQQPVKIWQHLLAQGPFLPGMPASVSAQLLKNLKSRRSGE